MYRIGIVCEGPADYEILQAILDSVDGLDDYQPTRIQPPTGLAGGESGPFGGGWKGLRIWCQQESNASAGFADILSNNDILIIQVDADVSDELEFAQASRCPPSYAKADAVRTLVLSWLKTGSIPRQVVLCVPSMATETWALVALFPTSSACSASHASSGSCVECDTKVKAHLRNLGGKISPKLVVGNTGKLKNQAKGYAAQAPKIARGWPAAVRGCTQARRFEQELEKAL